MIERRLLGESAELYPGDGAVSQAAKTTENIRAASPRAADGDVLLFLRRTLQFHSSDAAKQDVLEKLQNLKSALDLQQATLLSWPDSPSKDRICESLSKAKILIAQLVAEFGGTTGQPSPADIETA
jgi:hypothetical protein